MTIDSLTGRVSLGPRYLISISVPVSVALFASSVECICSISVNGKRSCFSRHCVLGAAWPELCCLISLPTCHLSHCLKESGRFCSFAVTSLLRSYTLPQKGTWKLGSWQAVAWVSALEQGYKKARSKGCQLQHFVAEAGFRSACQRFGPTDLLLGSVYTLWLS